MLIRALEFKALEAPMDDLINVTRFAKVLTVLDAEETVTESMKTDRSPPPVLLEKRRRTWDVDVATNGADVFNVQLL